MKGVWIVLILLYSLDVCSQTEIHAGNYDRKYETKNGELIEYKLSLGADGTFLFHSYRKVGAHHEEENKYAKGRWAPENTKLIIFHADQATDLDTTHTLNFNGSKARINNRSPRHKSKDAGKVSIRFYESDLFWVKGMELFKYKKP